MKRYSNLYEKIYNIENLRLAHKNAKKRKSHYSDVSMVDKNIDYYLFKIQDMLKNKTYKVSNYRLFTKLDKGKEREISVLPYFPDRIIQWAILQIVEPIWIKTFIRNTFSSIKNRGIHDALIRLQKSLKDAEGTKYCLKLDIKKFYPSINHVILKEIIRKKIKDRDLLWLLDLIIDSIDGDIGVPIGNYLSQFFGNLYLSYFDHWLKEKKKIKYYFRYCDDLVILHQDKQFLHRLYLEIEKYLSNNLQLTIKNNWQIFPITIRGIDFVGYRSFGKYILLRKSTKKAFTRKMQKLQNKDKLNISDYSSIMSYKGWLKWGNCHNLEEKYVAQLLNKEVME